MITWGTKATCVGVSNYGWGPTPEERHAAIDQLAETIHEQWGTESFAAGVIQQLAPPDMDNLEHRRWFAELIRLGRTPGDEIAWQRMNMEIDISHILSSIRVPTLVLHRSVNQETRIEDGRYFADQIPGARIVE